MDGRCRLILLQFICLVWPSPPHVTVDSFVLRRRSTVDDDQPLSDALYAVENLGRPGISYMDDVDQYDLLPQDVGDYEMNIPDDYDDDDVAKKLSDIIKRERDEEAAQQDYEDFDDGDYVNDDDDRWAEPLVQDYDSITNNEDVGSSAAKVSLDKAQLKKMFTDSDEQEDEHDLDKKTTELSKNDVEKLFDSATTDGAGDSAEVDNKASEMEIAVSVDGSLTNVDKIVKSIKEVKAGNDDVVGDKVIDVKEETVSPDDGKKLTKEWMVQLVQGEGDELGRSSGRKYKRSMDVQSGEEQFEEAAKQRAVDLLKTYIELQEEENHHLTEALNLATLAQTQRTDRYIDDEVKHLRQAVSDEAAIANLRDTIRADEGDVDENIEDEMKEEGDEEEQENEDQSQGDEEYSLQSNCKSTATKKNERWTKATCKEQDRV